MDAVVGPLLPTLRRLFSNAVTTTEEVSRAMLQVAKHGADKHVLENADIIRLGRAPA